jgi:hypothetical protein
MPVKTTKPIPAAFLHKNMGLLPGATVRTDMLRCTLLILLVISGITACMASTPPVQPSLLMTVSDNSADQNTTLTLQFTWNGYVGFSTPPEYIIVEAFFMADGTRLGAFPVSRETDPCETEHTCTYITSVSTVNFPPGEFMLVGTDPLSGASTRQLIVINTTGEGSRDFFRQFEQEHVFTSVSIVLTALLATVLAIMVRDRKSE